MDRATLDMRLDGLAQPVRGSREETLTTQKVVNDSLPVHACDPCPGRATTAHRTFEH